MPKSNESKEKENKSSILFTHYGDNCIRGSERCLLDLISHLDKSRFTPILWCNQPLMAEQAQNLGIKVYRSDFSLLLGWLSPKFSLSSYFNLVKQAGVLIKKHNIKVIHANSAAPCQWLVAPAKQYKVPLICHLHTFYSFRDRFTLRLYQANMVVGVSRYVTHSLLQDAMPKQRVCVIPNGIDIDRLEQLPRVDIRASLKLAKQDFVIATVGSLIKRKGIDLIIDCVAILSKQGLPVKLMVIGSGPQAHALQQQVSALALQNSVHFLGECENVFGVLKGGVDLFVSAAREEAFGLVLAEASLAKLAIVAPAVGGITDVVLDKETGLLVAAEDVQALSQAINTLYQTPQLRKQMAQAGFDHVMKNFTIRQNADRFASLYSSTINQPYRRKAWYRNAALGHSLLNVMKRLINKGVSYDA
jgi:glycosyltransferase involved in cell wall biosynthesis